MFIEEYNEEDYFDAFDDLDDIDYSNVSENSIKFAEAISRAIQSLIDEEDNLTEEFTSIQNAEVHFYRHCLYNVAGRRSTLNNVYYDFAELNKYIEYESVIDNKIKSSIYNITDLIDTDKILKAFKKLFEGSSTINFTSACGFFNNSGPVAISFNSWANSATNNYLNNTIDFVIRTPNSETITLYPIDAIKLEHIFNRELTRCGFNSIQIYNR